MISGAIHVDLTAEPTFPAYREDRYALDVLHACPDGARVIIDIGDRQYFSDEAVRWVHEHEPRLIIEIHGSDPRYVGAYIRAVRSGALSVVA